MVKNITIPLMIILFSISCNSQKCETIILQDGTTKVPKDFNECFQNKKFLQRSLPSDIESEIIYEEITQRTDYWYSVLKFYPNGKLNYFSFPDKTVYNIESFNPKIDGLRGRLVRNLKDGKNYIQLYTIVAANVSWGIKTEEISVIGDEIHIISKSGHISVFKKKIIPKEFLKYDADW